MKGKTFSRDVWLVLIVSFFYLSCQSFSLPIIAGYTELLGGAGFLMGFAGSLVNLVSLFCRPVVGNLADKIDKKMLAVGGLLLMLLGNAVCAIFRTMGVLMISRVISGIGYAGASVAISTWLSTLLPSDKVGAGMGLYGTVQALGMAVSPTAAIKIQEMLGYRAAFFTAAAMALAAMVFTLMVSDPGHSHFKGKSGFTLKIIDVNAAPIAAIMMLFAMPYIATQTFIISYLQRKALDINAEWYFLVYAIALIIIRTSCRDLFDKVPYKRFLFASIASSALCFILIHTARSTAVLMISSVFMAGGYGIMCSVSQAEAIILAGPGRRGIANSTYYVGLDLGVALGSMVAGVLFDLVGVNYFYPAMLVFPALCIVVFVLFGRKMKSVKTA